MPYVIGEIDGVPPENNRFPVSVHPAPHDLAGPEHEGQLIEEQIPSFIMRTYDHQNDPHTMIIDGRDVSVDGAKLDTIEAGAEINNINDQQAQSLTGGTHTGWHHHDDFYYRKIELFSAGQSEVNWANLINIPSAFNPSPHNHDDRYYTESEIDVLVDLYYSKSDLDSGQLDNRYFTESEITTNYYSKSDLDSGQLDNRYYTETEIDSTFLNYYAKTELDNGQLDNRYYTETEIDNILDGQYYTKIELDGGQLDNRYYTENEIDTILFDYYTIEQLNDVGQSQVHWDNITNKPTINGAQWLEPVQYRYFGAAEPHSVAGSVVGDRVIWFNGNQHIYELVGYNPPDGIPDENIDSIPPAAVDLATIRWAGDKWTVLNSILETNQQAAFLESPKFATMPTTNNTLIFEWDFKFINRASRGEYSVYYLTIDQISFVYKSRVPADPGNKYIRIDAGSGDVDYTNYWTDDDTWYNIRIEIDESNEVRVYYNNNLIITTTAVSPNNMYHQISWFFTGGTKDGNIQGMQLRNIRAYGEGLTWQWDDVYTPVQNDMVMVEDDGDGKPAQYTFDGTNWIKIADPDFGNHGSLSGLNNDDHPQYLNNSRHTNIKGNPHDTTITNVIQADSSTDITTNELEELTDGSTTSLHNHDDRYYTKVEITNNYYNKSQLDSGQLDNRYYTETESDNRYYTKTQLNNGQLDSRYFTESEITTNFYSKSQLDAGQLDSRYYTELEVNNIVSNYYTKTELNSGQLDNRYYTESEVDTLLMASAFGITGSVNAYDNLPTSADVGVIYIVKTTVGSNEEGFYRWNGSSWDFLANNTGVGTHNELLGLNSGDFKHLTNTEFVGLTGGSSTNLHNHDDRYYTETEIDSSLSNYYTKTDLDSGQLDNRYYTETEIDSTIGGYYSKTDLDNGQLDNRYFTETEVTTNYYDKTQLSNSGSAQVHWDNITNIPTEFAPEEHNHDNLYYRKPEVDSFVSDIYNSHYTKTDLDNGQLDNRYFTETEINSLFGDYYTKTELNSGELDDRYFTELEITTNYYDKSTVDSLLAGAAFGIVGSVSNFNELPTGNDIGEIYIVQQTVDSNEEGFYRWDGLAWNFLANNTGVGTLDHGNLFGLENDDHPQYAKKAGNETITGNWVFNSITMPSGSSLPSSPSVGEIFWNSNTKEFLIWDGSDWVSISDTGNSVSSDQGLSNNHVIVGNGNKSIKESQVIINNKSVSGVDYLHITRSGDEWMRLDHPSGSDLGTILVYKYTNAKTTMELIDMDDGPRFRLIQTGNGSESNPQWISEISQDNRKENLVFSTNGSAKFEIEENGTLHTRVNNYENLITNDDDIPNKKYVDDVAGSGNHGTLAGLTDDDHPQYLNELRHDDLPYDNPHNVNLLQVLSAQGSAFNIGDLEELTDGSTTSLHNHDDRYFTELEITTNYYNKSQLNNGQLDNRYYTEVEIDNIVAGLANNDHNHNDEYYTKPEIDTMASMYSLIGHRHDDLYYSKIEVDNLVATKADLIHNHDDRYFTKTQLGSDSGTSGAKRVGVSFIGGLTATNVQDALQELKNEISVSVSNLDEAYDAGRTITADTGPVKINSLSSNNSPLELTNRISAPTTGLAGGQMAVVNNELYVFNIDKNKWLTPSKTMNFGRNGSGDGHTLISAGGVRDDDAGLKMAKDGTIIGVAIHTTNERSGKDIYIRINQNIVYTVTTDSEGEVIDNSVNVDFQAGDVITLKVSSAGAPIQDPTAVVEYAWRVE